MYSAIPRCMATRQQREKQGDCSFFVCSAGHVLVTVEEETRSILQVTLRSRVPTILHSLLNVSWWINSFSPQKFTFSPQSYFYPLFLNEDGRILKNGFSKLHYRFRRYSTLTKTVLLGSQYLQSYDSLLIFLGQNLKKIVITLQILRFKQNCLSQSWISSKSIMQLIMGVPQPIY